MVPVPQRVYLRGETEMKEYHIVSTGLVSLTTKINEMAKQGWVPTHFVMAADEGTDTFAVMLERESREPTPKRVDS